MLVSSWCCGVDIPKQWLRSICFQPGIPAVTVPQPENSIQVLIDRAYEKGVSKTYITNN